MVMYAGSDMASVTVSPTAHGGCGSVHIRPAPGGVPVQPWRLECDMCEDFLRHDPHWAATAAEIPETYDEVKTREDFDKRGAKDKDAILTLALARLAGIGSDELPESLTRMISGVPAHVPALLECPQGHGQPAGRKFCAECGAPMRGTTAAAAITGAQEAAEQPATAPAGQKLPRMTDANLKTLQALAQAHGIDDSGTRSELIARLRAKGVTNLSGLPVAA